MKYLRTKNGAILRGTENRVDTDHYIAKQSDDLEKLFDKIVYFYQFADGQTGWEFVSEHDLGLPDWKTQYAFHVKENHLEVRGAISTEWGLKYVAKLNEKGEWELL